MDDEKKQAKNIKVYEDTVLSQKDRQAYEKRTRIYKVQSEQHLSAALKECRDMNRVPLIIRTPKCQLSLPNVKPMIVNGFQLGYTPESVQELNLRHVFVESFGNPLKKTE